MARRPIPAPGRPARTVADLAARIGAANAEAAAQRAADALRGIAPPPEREFRHAFRGEEARHAAGGNGGPRLDERAAPRRRIGTAEHLRLGELLYGDRYTTDLARVCGEDPRAVRRWKAGEGNAPGTVATFALRREAVERIAALTAAVEDLDAIRPPPLPPAQPPQPAPEVILAPGVEPEDAAWFIDQFARGDGGKPTPIRVILSAKRPPKGRRWTAEVILFDWSRQTIDCDRGADLGGGAVGFAAATVERPEPRIIWDEASGTWSRGPDWPDGICRPRREANAAPAQGGQV